jgi:hypothetical protein
VSDIVGDYNVSGVSRCNDKVFCRERGKLNQRYAEKELDSEDFGPGSVDWCTCGMPNICYALASRRPNQQGWEMEEGGNVSEAVFERVRSIQ